MVGIIIIQDSVNVYPRLSIQNSESIAYVYFPRSI